MIVSTAKDFLKRLEHILIFKRGEKRAPHKPLYLLFCISSLQKGRPRLQSFDEVRNKLRPALKKFGPPVGSIHPEYPFWRLQNDNLAEVVVDSELLLRKSNNDPLVSSLVKNNARGGLLEEDFSLLKNDPDLQSAAIHKILDAHFPTSIHEDIQHHFGLVLQDPHIFGKKTENEFYHQVFVAYDSTCAISGFSAFFDGKSVGIEATHICWPQAGGNDNIGNWIAMTSLHRKLYHLGLFGIDREFRIKVSPYAKVAIDSPMSLQRLNGEKIRLPQNPSCYPDRNALDWHLQAVFKS